MIESINITYISIFAVLLYLYLFLFTGVRTNSKAGELYEKVRSGLRSKINKNDKLRGIFEFAGNKCLPAISSKFYTGLRYVHTFSLFIHRTELFLTGKAGYYPAEFMNYSALALRKLYDGSPQVWLVYSSLLIVVFYFILTVF